MLITQPQAGESSGLLHFDIANVRLVRQEILGEFSGWCVEAEGKDVVRQSERTAGRISHARLRVGRQIDMPRTSSLAGSKRDIGPEFPIHMLKCRVNHRQMAVT